MLKGELMPPRKKEEWITGKEAAAILSEKSGHEVSQSYVRFLAYKAEKIQHRMRDGRTTEYLKSDVEKLRVRKNTRQKTIPRMPATKQEPIAA